MSCALAAKTKPDVALIDLQLPGIDGIETAVKLNRSATVAAIIVTSHGRPGYLKRALAEGALGFLPKTASAPSLVQAIRAAAAGQRSIDPALATEAIIAGDSPLTPREAHVLELAAQGAAAEEIAQRASLSVGTVRNYLSVAVTKLGATNRHQAVVIAKERGWI